MDLSFPFHVRFARRIPDPNWKEQYNAERHLFVVPVRDMPRGLPLDPNARKPKISRRIYQDVEKSLLNQDGEPDTFHQKNKGITIIANSVEQKSNHDYIVHMKSGIHGIVDGGHTNALIEKHLDNDELPENQFVNVEVRVGIPESFIPEIAGGLNTSVQVQDMSLDHLKGMFEWLKKILKSEPYFDQIAWSENDPGEFDARDLIALMTMFNVELFPNEKDEHPLMSYEKKSLALKGFEKKQDTFHRMEPIIKDILRFHDIIRQSAAGLYNKETGGKAGRLAFMEKRKRGKFVFPFTGKEDEFRLMNGALFPMLASFRWFVHLDEKTLKMRWRSDFDAVLEFWKGTGGELMRATLQTSNELGRNPNAIGKSRNHWSNLHARVAKADLLARQAAI